MYEESSAIFREAMQRMVTEELYKTDCERYLAELFEAMKQNAIEKSRFLEKIFRTRMRSAWPFIMSSLISF